jgi:hypothetical protein
MQLEVGSCRRGGIVDVYVWLQCSYDPQKDTVDSLSTLSILVSYPRLAPNKFQHSLSAVALGFYLRGVEDIVNGHGTRYSITRLSAWPIQCSYLIYRVLELPSARQLTAWLPRTVRKQGARKHC